MTLEKSPAETYRRGEPLVIWTDDNTKLELWAESGGVASVADGQVARSSNPEWSVRAKGTEYALGMEATLNDTERDVTDRALRWWNEKRRGGSGG